MQLHPSGVAYNDLLTNQPPSCQMRAIEDVDRHPILTQQQAPASYPPWMAAFPLPQHPTPLESTLVNNDDNNGPIPKEASSPARSLSQQSDSSCTERPRSVTPIDRMPVSALAMKPTATVPMTAPISTTTAGGTAVCDRKQLLANAPPRRVVKPRPHDHDWPLSIVDVNFFGPCPHHSEDQKNEVHFYCLGCSPTEGSAMCQHCLPSHATGCTGRVLQVYRYMYHDVIRIADFGKLIPLNDIQAYKANGHPAVHLRPRDAPKTKSPAGFTGRCGGCRRALSSDWTYCSLVCKLGLAQEYISADTRAYAGAGGSRPDSVGLPAGAETVTASLGREPVRGGRGGVASDEETDTAARLQSVPKRRSNIGLLKGAKRRKTEWPMRSSVF